MSAIAAPDFFARTRSAKKIMVLDLGFLGDTIHLLPALWMIRQAYPNAELHATVASHITSLMQCAPWVDKVWGYMRYPRHATLRENYEMVRNLRREKFDVLINLNGSDRSSWLTFFSGAKERLGRVPDDGGPPFWRHMFTAHVQHPYDLEPAYLQKCHCLQNAGFSFTKPEFHVSFQPENLRAADISEADAGTYFHLSPFTTADYKELSPAQFAELVAGLIREFPGKRIVLSCAPTEREKNKMSDLLARLPQKPWRVFPGNLNLLQLAAVIQNSALHFCGDTGTLHLAVAAGTPAVSWFWPNPGMKIWVPADGPYSVITGTNPAGETYLADIDNIGLLAATRTLLAGVEAGKMPAP